MDDVPPAGDDGQADADRQHVHRRHLDRPHVRGAPGERRDRRGGRPGHRPRHRRHRLHLPRHHRAGARGRRRDLRGERRTRLPDAHPPDDRRPAVHLQVGRRHAVPARGAEPDPDRRRHRHQRQDHDLADDRAHLQGHGPQGRYDVDRRRRHRRAAGDPRRRVRTEVGPDGAAEPARRLRRLRGGPWRHPARRSRLRAQRRRRRAQRAARPPRDARHQHGRAARRRQGGARRGGAPQRSRRAQRRRPAGASDAAPLLRRGRVVQHGAARAARCATSSTPTAVAAARPSCWRRASGAT